MSLRAKGGPSEMGTLESRGFLWLWEPFKHPIPSFCLQVKNAKENDVFTLRIGFLTSGEMESKSFTLIFPLSVTQIPGHYLHIA